jgi:glycosyltransferase 2 family protein
VDHEVGEHDPGWEPEVPVLPTPPGHHRPWSGIPVEPETVVLPQPAEPPEPQTDAGQTLVIEDGVIPGRLRRPADLVRFTVAVVAAAVVFLLAYFATSTATGIDRDISTASSNLPGWLLLPLSVVSGFGVILLPAAVAVELLVRRRARQLADAMIALFVASLVIGLYGWWATRFGSDRLWLALAGTPLREVTPMSGLLGGIVAFATVARLAERTRWAVITAVVVVGSALARILAGGTTIGALGITILVGWAVGVATRYALGTPTTRPSGIQVADALARAGFPLTVLRATRNTERGRRYAASTRNGTRLEVVVLDRDLEGAGTLTRLWRTVRVRDDDAGGGWSMRRMLERAALLGYASQLAGAPVPRLRAVSEIGPDSSLLAYEHLDGVTFDTFAPDDDDLIGAWRALRTLHDDRIAHRALSADHLLRAPDGGVFLLDVSSGTIAMSDLQERVDVAELLATLAVLTTPDRAIAVGQQVLGIPRLVRALPVLQPVVFSRETRHVVRRRKETLAALRDGLATLTPTGEVEAVEFERVKPRTVLTVIAGTVAAYVLFGQLAQVDLLGLFRSASWEWVGVAAVFAVITFIGAAMSLQGFVLEKLSLWRTFLAQLAAGFATLVTPPTLGTVAVNVRYLQKAGLHPALAAASVGVSQLLAFFAHLGLLALVGIVAGTQQDLSFDPPREVVIAVAVVALLVIGALPLPPVRRWLMGRLRPTFARVGPRLITVLQRPGKLAVGVGGILLLNLAFCACLVASVRAFDGGGSLAAIAIVYLAGSTLGQAAPTPGGVGAVEAVMTAGLVAAGVDGAIALSAVLLFRFLTFWLPTIPGYLSFQWMTRQGAL